MTKKFNVSVIDLLLFAAVYCRLMNVLEFCVLGDIWINNSTFLNAVYYGGGEGDENFIKFKGLYFKNKRWKSKSNRSSLKIKIILDFIVV